MIVHNAAVTRQKEERQMASFGNRTTTPGAAPPPRSRYGGISCADTRDPMLGYGRYRVRVLSASRGFNPGKNRESYKTSLQVIEADDGADTPAGSIATMVNFMSSAGLSELKRFAVHAAGFGPTLAARDPGAGVNIKQALLDGEAAYDALEEKLGYLGIVLEATEGVANGAPSLVGRLVDVVVVPGKPVMNPQTNTPTGDNYRAYTWGAVPDAEQA